MEAIVEEWRPVAEFPTYEVSDHGRVRRIGKTECLKPGGSGYRCVNLCSNGKEHYRLVHRLVAMAFIENPEAKPCVDHIDGNKSNNHMSNLRWATRSENQYNMRTKAAYKGVRWNKQREKWEARIMVDDYRLHLGYYDDPLEAYYVYCAAAVFYFGDFACG